MNIGGTMEIPTVRARAVFLYMVEIALRIPGFFLFELWWCNEDVLTTDMRKKSSVGMDQIVQFIQTKNFDHPTALILSYAVVVASAMFFLLPIVKLVQVYLYMVSLFLFAVTHHVLARYVLLGQGSNLNLNMDDFTKLERLGFHILAQLGLCIAQCCVLDLERSSGWIAPAIFLIPIIARMCSLQIDCLIIVHSATCSVAMLMICIYMLSRTPALLIFIRHIIQYLKTVVIFRGIGGGAAVLWRRLRFAEILISAWLVMFFVRLYVAGLGKNFGEFGVILLSSVAQSTNTPLSLLALALTVCCICKQVVDVTEFVVCGQRSNGHILAAGGNMEALTLVLLCAQTGLLRMRTEQKAFLLGLVLFIVASALLHSLVELLEPQLLNLSVNRLASRNQHVRCIFLALFLIMASLCASIAIAQFLPIDLWYLIIVSNYLLTAVHAVSAIAVYGIFVFEARFMDVWEWADVLVFKCKMVTCAVEIIFALSVLCYGVFTCIDGQWTLTSLMIFLMCLYFNVWNRLQAEIAYIQTYRAASRSLSRLPTVSKAVLRERKGACAICLSDMVENARMTPCKHVFHTACLQRWLCVKQVCPLCYAEVCKLNVIEAAVEEQLFFVDSSEMFDTENLSKNDLLRIHDESLNFRQPTSMKFQFSLLKYVLFVFPTFRNNF